MNSRLRRQFVRTAICLCACFTEMATAQQTYANRTFGLVQSPAATVACAYFQLVGVTQADPSVPGDAWFAIPTTQNGFTEIYAMMVAAKLAGAPVTVGTTGAVAGGSCGTNPGVSYIQLF
jgi:hypothetical protein